MSDRRTEYSPSHNHCKRTIIPRSAPTLPKPHYPLLCTITLASLVKGRWIDGKAQALILLLSVCDTPTFFIYQTFLPSRRRDCFTPTNLSKTALSHPLFVGRASACACTASYPHYPLLSTTSLPPLEKGEVLSPEIIRATTGGIVTPPTFFKTALSLAPHPVLPSLDKGEVLSP